jgi:YD repeat-containing protein
MDDRKECRDIERSPWEYGAPGTGDSNAIRYSLGEVEDRISEIARKNHPQACRWEWVGSYGTWYSSESPGFEHIMKMVGSTRTLYGYDVQPETGGCTHVVNASIVDPFRSRIIGCNPPFTDFLVPGEVGWVCVRHGQVPFGCPEGCGDNTLTFSGGNPIMFDSGTKYQRENDISAPTGPLSFTRLFASAWNDLGEAGMPGVIARNWRHNFERSIVVITSARGFKAAYALRGIGTSVVFRKAASGWNAIGDGFVFTLTELADATGTTTGWRLDTPDATETYDAGGRLVQIANANGVNAYLTYEDGMLRSVSDDFGRSLALTYDANGRLATVTDPDGRTHRYFRDFRGDLSSVLRPDGSTRTYLYEQYPGAPSGLTGIVDENGKRFSKYTYWGGRAVGTELAGGVDRYTVGQYVTDPIGTHRYFHWNAINNIDRVTMIEHDCYPSCNLILRFFINYDGRNNIAETLDFNGNGTCFRYDQARNVEVSRLEGVRNMSCDTAHAATQLAAPMRKVSTEWHPRWRVPRRTAEPLRITTHEYNGDGATACAPAAAATALLCRKTVQATTDPSGIAGFGATADGPPRTWTYTYDAQGRVLTTIGPRTDLVDATVYSYYVSADISGAFSKGDLALVTNALGQTTRFTHYDRSGRLKRMVDPNGRETLLDHSPRGWLKSRAIGTAASGYETTTYDYDAVGQLTRVTSPDGSTVNYVYDDAHRLVEVLDGLGNRIRYTLDGKGNRIVEEAFDTTGSLARSRSKVIDLLDREVKEIGGTDPASQVTEHGYDYMGNLTSTRDPLGRVTTWIRDSRYRVLAMQDPVNGTGAPTRYEYDGRDQLRQVTDPMGQVTSYVMNGHGELLGESSPDTGATAFTYDAAGNVRTKLDARGVLATYSYDALNRLTRIEYGDETVVNEYDGCPNGVGRLCRISDKTGTTTYGYDVWGRVISKAQAVAGLTQTISYGYNSAGQLATVTLPSGRKVTYGYLNNRPVSVLLDGKKVLDGVFYEPFGPNGGWRWGNSTPAVVNTHTRLYDKDFRATRITSDLPAAGAQPALDRQLTWDAQGRVQSIADLGSSVLSATYGYDALDRLTTVAQGATAIAYTYNGVGDRLSATVDGATATYSYVQGTHRLQSLAGAQARSYTHDAAGNRITDGALTWSYGNNNRATQAGATTFLVNALGQRVKKTSAAGATRFVYDEAGRLWGEYDENGKANAETIWLEDLPVAVFK